MEIKLVIFDCDGVLVDSELISSRVMSEIFGEIGLEMSAHEVFETLRGGSMAETIAFVESRLGASFNYDLEKEYRKRSFEAYKNEMKPIEGIEQILQTLNIPCCVGSNGPQHKIKLNLDITDLRQYFTDDHIFSSYDIQVWKPKPDLYLYAAARFNLDPKECIVIEDSVSGATAAQKAGIKCYGFARDTHAQEFLAIDAIPIMRMEELLILESQIFKKRPELT